MKYLRYIYRVLFRAFAQFVANVYVAEYHRNRIFKIADEAAERRIRNSGELFTVAKYPAGFDIKEHEIGIYKDMRIISK